MPEEQPHERRLDRVLESDYLAGIEQLDLEALREMRNECVEVETEVSYVRRLAQARIEILEAELERRGDGGSVEDLIAALPRILADEGPRSGPAQARLPQPLAPSMSIEWNRGLERLVSDATLANLPTLSEEELGTTLGELRDFEEEISGTRSKLHEVIDTLELELAARHASA